MARRGKFSLFLDDDTAERLLAARSTPAKCRGGRRYTAQQDERRRRLFGDDDAGTTAGTSLAVNQTAYQTTSDKQSLSVLLCEVNTVNDQRPDKMISDRTAAEKLILAGPQPPVTPATARSPDPVLATVCWPAVWR